MANPTASASVTAETMLLDIDTITPEKWRTLIYNKIVKQKDIFVDDFKNNIINTIEGSMKDFGIKNPAQLDTLRKNLVDKIKQNTFDIEYHKFIDGIVGVTFEYFCQLIIINSFDNIKRTQNALSCFTNNVNAVGSNNQLVKPHFNVNHPEQSTSAQIQCLSGSNANTTETDESVNLTQIFNNSNSILLNTHSSKINTTSLAVGLSGINLTNKYVCTNNSPINNEDDELKSDSSILSIAMNINEEDLNMRFADDFENDDINNEMRPTTLIVEQNSDANRKSEEELQMNTGLKLLQNLVNIEHDKLEIQKSLTTVELPQSKPDSNEKKPDKMVNKANTGNNMNLFKTPNQNIVGELLQNDTELKTNDLRQQAKPKRKYDSYLDQTMRKKPKTMMNDLNTKKQLDKIYAMYNKNSKSAKSTPTIIANISVNKKECTATSTSTTTNALSIITNPIASTSSYTGDLSKYKPFSPFVLTRTHEDCRKIYEMDRRSLFSPDIVFGLKPKIKENKALKKPDNKNRESDKMFETKGQKTNVTAESKKVNDKLIKVKIGSIKDKLLHCNKTVPNSTFRSPAEHNNIMKPKISINTHKQIEQKSSTEANANTNNKKEELNIPDILKNKELNDSKVTLENQEPGSEQILKNQELNDEQLLPENPVLSADSSENSDTPEWIKKLFELYNIKPVYVVIEKNKKY